jgi:hypothetical protein
MLGKVWAFAQEQDGFHQVRATFGHAHIFWMSLTVEDQ